MKLIELTQGKFAKVDDHWFDFINQWKWFYDGDGYAIRNGTYRKGKQPKILMHRIINKTPKGILTDHRDGDKLNNQEENLRNANRSQNAMNRKSHKNTSSKYKGVSWHIGIEKWVVRIMINQKMKNIGSFDLEIEAAKAYDKEALELFGEFALLNFPHEAYCEPE